MFGILGLFVQAAAGQILYLALHLESGSFPRPLPAAQERAAFAALAAGGPCAAAARDTLIRHNLRLVAHVAKKYYANPDSQDDLISIGTIGLIKAVDSFDTARAVRFSSYASQCIENEIRMHLRRLRREGTTVSLQEPLESGSNDSGMLTLADTLPDDTVMEDDCERRETSARLRAMVNALPARDRELLCLRYGLDGGESLTQQEVALRFGISRSYVSRLEKRALEQLGKQWDAQK